MFKSIPLGACLVCMAALIGAGAVPARAGGTSAPAVARQPMEFGLRAASTANLVEGTLSQMLGYTVGPINGAQSPGSGSDVSTSLLRTIWSSATISSEHDGDDRDKDKAKEKEKEDEGPAPTPEPGTLFSFGAALAIGGGVFVLGRLRRERK